VVSKLFDHAPYIIIIIIIIGSTALRGPWPSTEASDSWSIRLLLLQISWQESFPRWGFQPHTQPPDITEDRCFLSGLSPLVDLVGTNGITRVLSVYACQQGVYPRGHVLPLRLPRTPTSISVKIIIKHRNISLYIICKFICIYTRPGDRGSIAGRGKGFFL
jgi:hypothetical protein